MTPEELADEAKNRLGHPFMGSFTIAMILHNWPLFLITFTGDQDYWARWMSFSIYLHDHKIAEIFGWPLAVATLYSLVLTHLFSIVLAVVTDSFGYWRERAQHRVKIAVEGSEAVLLPQIQKIAQTTITQLNDLSEEVDRVRLSVSQYRRNGQEVKDLELLMHQIAHIKTGIIPVVKGTPELIKARRKAIQEDSGTSFRKESIIKRAKNHFRRRPNTPP